MIYINFLIKDISISSLFYLPKKERDKDGFIEKYSLFY